MSLTETFVTFDLAGALYALPVSVVVEILDVRAPSRLPRAPAYLLGLIDRRGLSVPVVDMRVLLGEPARPDTSDTRFLVLRVEGDAPAPDARPAASAAAGGAAGHASRVVGLRVDRVVEVTSLDAGEGAPLPEAGMLRWTERMVAGIGRRQGDFVTCLDIDGLFDGVALESRGDAA